VQHVLPFPADSTFLRLEMRMFGERLVSPLYPAVEMLEFRDAPDSDRSDSDDDDDDDEDIMREPSPGPQNPVGRLDFSFQVPILGVYSTEALMQHLEHEKLHVEIQQLVMNQAVQDYDVIVLGRWFRNARDVVYSNPWTERRHSKHRICLYRSDIEHLNLSPARILLSFTCFGMPLMQDEKVSGRAREAYESVLDAADDQEDEDPLPVSDEMNTRLTPFLDHDHFGGETSSDDDEDDADDDGSHFDEDDDLWDERDERRLGQAQSNEASRKSTKGRVAAGGLGDLERELTAEEEAAYQDMLMQYEALYRDAAHHIQATNADMDVDVDVDMDADMDADYVVHRGHGADPHSSGSIGNTGTSSGSGSMGLLSTSSSAFKPVSTLSMSLSQTKSSSLRPSSKNSKPAVSSSWAVAPSSSSSASAASSGTSGSSTVIVHRGTSANGAAGNGRPSSTPSPQLIKKNSEASKEKKKVGVTKQAPATVDKTPKATRPKSAKPRLTKDVKDAKRPKTPPRKVVYADESVTVERIDDEDDHGSKKKQKKKVVRLTKQVFERITAPRKTPVKPHDPNIYPIPKISPSPRLIKRSPAKSAHPHPHAHHAHHLQDPEHISTADAVAVANQPDQLDAILTEMKRRIDAIFSDYAQKQREQLLSRGASGAANMQHHQQPPRFDVVPTGVDDPVHVVREALLDMHGKPREQLQSTFEEMLHDAKRAYWLTNTEEMLRQQEEKIVRKTGRKNRKLHGRLVFVDEQHGNAHEGGDLAGGALFGRYVDYLTAREVQKDPSVKGKKKGKRGVPPPAAQAEARKRPTSARR
jgi:hypothetical protein